MRAALHPFSRDPLVAMAVLPSLYHPVQFLATQPWRRLFVTATTRTSAPTIPDRRHASMEQAVCDV